MTPEDVLNGQHDLVQKLDRPRFRMYCGSVIAVKHTDNYLIDTDPETLDYLIRGLQDHVRGAYAYRVTKNMVPVVLAAAAALDSTDRVNKELAPTGSGIVHFETPLPFHEVRGGTMLVSWMVWGPIEGGVAVWLFNDNYEQPDKIAQALIEEYGEVEVAAMHGRWGFIGANTMRDGEILGEDEIVLDPAEAIRITNEGAEVHPYSNAGRHLHALWLLLNQTLVDVSEETVARSTRKRMGRMRLPGRVSVVQLRRRQGHPSDGETYVEWQHQWVVRGHWAWRVCGQDHPGAQPYKAGWGVRLWIAPYLKGPEDKPLVQTDRVYDLRR